MFQISSQSLRLSLYFLCLKQYSTNDDSNGELNNLTDLLSLATSPRLLFVSVREMFVIQS
jgi:hypothetical protein